MRRRHCCKPICFWPKNVISDNEDIVLRAAAAEAAAFSLLALQAPVAGDRRAVISTIRNVADVDRMGAFALHVANSLGGDTLPRHCLKR